MGFDCEHKKNNMSVFNVNPCDMTLFNSTVGPTRLKMMSVDAGDTMETTRSTVSDFTGQVPPVLDGLRLDVMSVDSQKVMPVFINTTQSVIEYAVNSQPDVTKQCGSSKVAIDPGAVSYRVAPTDELMVCDDGIGGTTDAGSSVLSAMLAVKGGGLHKIGFFCYQVGGLLSVHITYKTY